MKKIVLGLFILFGITFNVEAKQIFYSAYSDFSEYSLNKIESSELINVEVERRYRWYKENKIGEYRTFLSDNSSFDYVDFNDERNSSFSPWQEEEPNTAENRVIEEKVFYQVKTPQPIQYISFINTLDGKLSLKDIEVYYMDDKIDFDISLYNTSDNVSVNKDGCITLDLKKYYNLEDIFIKIGDINFDNIWAITASASVLSDDGTYKINYFTYFIEKPLESYLEINPKDWSMLGDRYNEEQIYETLPNYGSLSVVTPIKLYRYKDPEYYFYNVKKDYVDGYFANYDGLIKDENDYQDYYRYQIRDKFEISDDIIITDYNQTLSNYFTSTADYQINTNLDINKNGIYEAEFVTYFNTIKKPVHVSIVENALKEQQNDNNTQNSDLKEENNNLKNQLDLVILENQKLNNNINSLIVENDKLKQELSQFNKDYLNLVNQYNSLKNQKLEESVVYDNECSLKLEEALNKFEDSDKKLKLSNQANEYLQKSLLQIDDKGVIKIEKNKLIGFIIFLILLLILLIIFLKKLSDKN